LFKEIKEEIKVESDKEIVIEQGIEEKKLIKTFEKREK